MMERFSQGYGKQKKRDVRRVDVASGRLIMQQQAHPIDNAVEKAGFTTKSRTVVSLLGVMVILVVASLTLSGCASQAQKVNPSIEIESVRITAAGHYIDLRYRVLDAERANQSLGPGVKPVLIDEATGTVMQVPMTAKLGALRQTRGVQRPDRNYFVLFANTAGLTSGGMVTAEIGGMTFERLTIE